LPDWITTTEAARLSGYDMQHVRRLARQGKIGAEKKGRDGWIDRETPIACVEAVRVGCFCPA
jgi:excisionase family DNA binding protein